MEADTQPVQPPLPIPRRITPPPLCPTTSRVILQAVGILLDYGRHLIDTVRQRATAPNFNAIAACFGTANLATILAHLNRGILRAEALERMLLARAATGRDIDFVERRTRAPAPQPAPATEPEQPAAAPPVPRKRASAPPPGTIPNSSCPPSRTSIVRCAAAPSAAPSTISARISPSSQASATAPSGTSCTR